MVVATFIPPIRHYNSPTYPWDRRAVPFCYMPGTPKGVNVYMRADGSCVENRDPGNAAYIYLGGHEYTVSASEAALLTAAGYTVT